MQTYGDAFGRIGGSNATKNLKWLLRMIQRPLAEQDRVTLSREVLAFAVLPPFTLSPNRQHALVRAWATKSLPAPGFDVDVEIVYKTAKRAIDELMGEEGQTKLDSRAEAYLLHRGPDSSAPSRGRPALWVVSDKFDRSALAPHTWRMRLALVLYEEVMVTNKIRRCADPTCPAPLFVQTRSDERYCCKGHRWRVNKRSVRSWKPAKTKAQERGHIASPSHQKQGKRKSKTKRR